VSVSPAKARYAPALGVPGRAALLPGAPPAYALGGVTDPTRARQAGGCGVAAVGAVLRADRPEQLLAGLLPALGESG